jgi:3-oxoacyl-[acyl-carrier protein] reductase
MTRDQLPTFSMPPIGSHAFLLFGASSGMGAAVAAELSRNGASLILASRNETKLKATAAACKTLALNGAQTFDTHVLDLTCPASPRRLAATLTGRTIQGVLLNGGGPQGSPADQISPEELDSAHALLFRGPALHLQAVLGMISFGGQILAITSTTVKEPHAALTLSGAYRSALSTYLKSLSDALGPRNICVNSIAPGFVDTAQLNDLRSKEAQRLGVSLEDINTKWASRSVFQRLGTPAEIASFAGFLLRGGCPFLTGQTIVIDGGQTRSTH